MQKINKASFPEKGVFYFASKIRDPPAVWIYEKNSNRRGGKWWIKKNIIYMLKERK